MVGAKCESEIILTISTDLSFFNMTRINAFYFNFSLLDLDFCLKKLTIFKVVN